MNLKTIIETLYIDNFEGPVLEAGAADYRYIVTKDFHNTNDVWYLEPVKETYDRFLDYYPNILNYALSNYDGKTKFTITSHGEGGNSSIEHHPDHIEDLKKFGSTFTETTIDCISYPSLLEKLNLIFEILVLDVEEHELIVLQSINELPVEKQPKIIVIECGYTWKSKLDYLQKMGYNIDTYWTNNCILSRNLKTDVNYSNMYNNTWKQFSFNGRLIYQNY